VLRGLSALLDKMATNFKRLKIWQRAIDIGEKIYLLTGSFPREEIYSLTDQVRRASVSISSNIAEGSE
jgi:four helix bundle protein